MRAIDADAIVVHKFPSEDYDPSENDTEKAYRKGWNDALDAVAEFQPSAEPVRCKDCYYCVSYKSFDKTYYCCDAFEAHAEGDLIGVSLQVDPNHYCSWAERRRG